MKKYLYDYIKKIDNKIEKRLITKQEINDHLIKVGFFQHEREIHLFVTLAYAIMAIVSFAISIISPMFVFVGVILVAFLIPYVLHYFNLENGVQYLYKQYDKMKEIIDK